MARRTTVSARIASLLGNLSATQLSATADFLENVVVGNADEDIGEIETSTRASRRKAKAAAKAKAEEKPAARGTRKTRTTKVEEEKPARRTRRSAKVEDDADDKPVARRARKPKAEAFEGDITVDDLFDVLDTFEGEPVAGTIRDLKPLAEAYGFDVADIYAAAEEEAGGKLSSAEKAVEIGVALASAQALEAKIVATLKEDEGAFDEIIEELELELSERASNAKIAKAIIADLLAEEAEADDEDEDEDEDDADDEEEEEAPARRSRRSAKAEEKPTRKSRKAKDDDLSDLDDLDD